MRDILIRPHDDHAPCLPIDAAHCKDVVTAPNVSAEKLLIVVEAIAAFLGLSSDIRNRPRGDMRN